MTGTYCGRFFKNLWTACCRAVTRVRMTQICVTNEKHWDLEESKHNIVANLSYIGSRVWIEMAILVLQQERKWLFTDMENVAGKLLSGDNVRQSYKILEVSTALQVDWIILSRLLGACFSCEASLQYFWFILIFFTHSFWCFTGCLNNFSTEGTSDRVIVNRAC